MTRTHIRTATAWRKVGQFTAAPVYVSPSKALPGAVAGAWWFCFKPGPSVDVINSLPSSKRPNFYSAAIAQQTGGAGSGAVNFSPGNVQSDASFIAAMKASGRPWVLCIGGGGDATTLNSQVTEDQMFNSLTALITKYGFCGIDWDIENSNWTAQRAANVSNRLLNEHGTDLIIGCSPRPYEMAVNPAGIYRQLCTLLGAKLSYASYQFYDAAEFKDDTYLRNRIKSEMQNFVTIPGCTADKFIIGAITNPTYSLGWNDPQAYVNGYNDCVAIGLRPRGFMVWETKLENDSASNWAATTAFRTAVGV